MDYHNSSGTPNYNLQNSSEFTVSSKQNNKRRLIGIVLTIIIIIVLIFSGSILLTKKQNSNFKSGNNTKVSTDSLMKPNPKIQVLVKLPPEDPHVVYNIYMDPQPVTLAYSVNKDQYTASSSSTIVVNGNIGKTYDKIDNLMVSPDGKRVAFIATKNKKQLVVVDGIEGKPHEYIRSLTFSPDSQHIAYAVGEGIYFHKDSPFSGEDMTTDMFIIIDDAEGKKYGGTYAGVNVADSYVPSFSRNGKEITYTAIKNGKNIIVVNDKELSEFSDQNYPQFIGDSYDIVYIARDNNKYFLVVANQRKQSYNYISSILNRSIYLGKDISQIAYEATNNKAAGNDLDYVIVNDIPYSVPSGRLQDFVFSNTGKYFAYYTGTWMKQDLYINGKLFGNAKPDAQTNIGDPIFSPNARLLIYSETHQKEQNVIVHVISPESLKKIFDYPLPGYKAIGLIKFSDDSKNIFFKAWHERTIEFVTLDVETIINKSTK